MSEPGGKRDKDEDYAKKANYSEETKQNKQTEIASFLYLLQVRQPLHVPPPCYRYQGKHICNSFKFFFFSF